MIRNVKDVTELLDRRFGSALSHPLSLVRTLAWMLVGLCLMGFVVPAAAAPLSHTRALRGTSVRDVILNKNDPRGWAQPRQDPHTFRIAWIGGSTIQTVPPRPGFLPADVVQRLPKIDGRPVQVTMYLMEASRVVDLYAATAEALSTKPDMVVLDLNPLWLFNTSEIQEWTNLNPAALPHLVTRPGTWPLLAAMYSPGDAALSIAARPSTAIRDRWSYSQRLQHDLDRISLVNQAPAKKSTAQLSGAALIATMTSPLAFWNYYRLIPSDVPTLERYPEELRLAKTDGSALNDLVVRQMLGALAASHIPSLAYLSAVDPTTLTNPATEQALERVESHLRQIAGTTSARTLQVQWQSGTRLVHGLAFRDMVHMTNDAPMADLLAGTLCTQLKAIDPQTSCSPNPETEP